MTSLLIKRPLQGVGWWIFSWRCWRGIGGCIYKRIVGGLFGVFIFFRVFLTTDVTGDSYPGVSLIVLGWFLLTNCYYGRCHIVEGQFKRAFRNIYSSLFWQLPTANDMHKPALYLHFLNRGEGFHTRVGYAEGFSEVHPENYCKTVILVCNFSTTAVWNFCASLIQSMGELSQLGRSISNSVG